MNNESLGRFLTTKLSELNKPNKKVFKVFTVNGKKCRLKKVGKKWTRVEIRGK